MELSELENLIKGYDNKINESINLNKSVLKNILSDKPEKQIRIERLRTAYHLSTPLFLPCFLVIITQYLDITLKNTINTQIGFGVFIPAFLILWGMNVKYYLLLRQLSFALPLTAIKKRIAELESYSIKMTKFRIIFTPFLIIGLLLIFLPYNIETNYLILFIALTVLINIASSIYNKYAVKERYRDLKKEIDELDSLCK